MKLPAAVLLALASLSLAGPLAGPAAADAKSAPRFSSETTPLYPNKRCKAIAISEEEGEQTLRCPAKRGFLVEVGFSAWATHVELTGPSTSVRFDGTIGAQIEWRLADGKPFAVIVRVNEQEPDDDGLPDPKATRLVVRGVNGWKIEGEVAAGAKDAVKAAQDLADTAYRARSGADRTNQARAPARRRRAPRAAISAFAGAAGSLVVLDHQHVGLVAGHGLLAAHEHVALAVGGDAVTLGGRDRALP
jgi:hypothetical protein